MVRGFPIGGWLHVNKEEVERRRVEKRCAWSVKPPESGAWVLSEGSVAPRWASVTAHRVGPHTVELSWPGIPGAGATYSVKWRIASSEGGSGDDATEGVQAVGIDCK